MALDLVRTKSHQAVYPGYFEFSLTYETSQAGATEALRLYAVSRRTGDVWEVNLCHRYAFPTLVKEQAAIQRWTGYSLADDAASVEGLGCPDSSSSKQ